MSAYFVTPETVIDAAFALKFDVQDSAFDSLGLAAVGQLLWQLNALALKERYDEDMEEYLGQIIGLTEATRPEVSTSEWQRLKSLKNLSYQCAEGDVPETELYRLMEAAEEEIGERLTGGVGVIYDRPEYEAAEWNRG